MMSTVTTRGQTAIPAAIRRQYNISAQSRIEWIDDGHSIAIVPVPLDPITSLRGRYKRHGFNNALMKSRVEERNRG